MTFIRIAPGHCLRNWCSALGYIMTILLFIGCSNPYSKPFTLMSRGGDSAIIELNQMLEKNPQDSIALYARGCTYSNIRRFDEAIADFDKVLEINKQYIASATSTKSTSSSTNPTSSEAYKEFLTLSEMSSAASIGVGSRTGFAGSLGALGALGAVHSDSFAHQRECFKIRGLVAHGRQKEQQNPMCVPLTGPPAPCVHRGL